jgi:hypothetical protein
VEVISNALQDAHELRLQLFSDKYLIHLNGPIGAQLLASIQEEARIIRDLLVADPPADVQIPDDRLPPICRFLPYPRAHDSSPPPALVIRGDRIEKFGDRHSSYLYAGETSSQIGYLLVSEEWREIALIAFQNVLYRSYVDKYHVVVDREISDAESEIRGPTLKLEALFRPSLELERVARRCKVKTGDVEMITASLVRAKYFDVIPTLRPQRITPDIEAIADRFGEFSGEESWKIRAPHLASFVSQFPSSLRQELLDILRNKDRFLFLDRTETINLIIQALADLPLERPLRLVPLTPSSGQNIRNHIRNAVDPAATFPHATLGHALSTLQSHGGSIVFVDDNIASGTQASRQIAIFMGDEAEKPYGNYTIERLEPHAADILRSKSIGAAFAVGHEEGKAKLSDTATHYELKLEQKNIVYSRPVSDVSGKTTVSESLRTFLRETGEAVLKRRFECEQRENAGELALTFALGYGGLEGLMATSFSVPTSTYPAFWCPGIRRAEPLHGTGVIEVPWLPLFIRTNMLTHLVLG